MNFGRGNKISIAELDKETLKILKQRMPEHPIFSFSDKEQKEYMQLIRDGQGSFIRQGIKDGVSSITIPGLGSFLANPLRDIVQDTKKEFKNTLFPHEINQIIKQRLGEFFKTHRHPFKNTIAKPRQLDKLC